MGEGPGVRANPACGEASQLPLTAALTPAPLTALIDSPALRYRRHPAIMLHRPGAGVRDGLVTAAGVG